MAEKKYPYGYGLSVLSRFKLHLNRLNVRKWSFFISLAGIAILGVYYYFRGPFGARPAPNLFDHLVVFVYLFLGGCLGFLRFYRRPIPALTFRDRLASRSSLLMMLGCWGLALYSLMVGMRNLLER